MVLRDDILVAGNGLEDLEKDILELSLKSK